jgi:hypothetical protein
VLLLKHNECTIQTVLKNGVKDIQIQIFKGSF